MGGLIGRRAAERLGRRLSGLLLVDPTPETAPVYDTFDRTARQVDISLAMSQPLLWIRPLAWLSTAKIRRQYPADTYATMLREDFTPAGIGQTRKEFQAVAAAIHQFRAAPPAPPHCPTVVLSATRPFRRGSAPHIIGEHQRRWVESLPDGRFEAVDSSHLIQAEQPQLVADAIRGLLDRRRHADARGPN
jgi:pimeloyl-ACP methyl ester carboxylesterase